jgi:8-oxo-dGTP diphosphatase
MSLKSVTALITNANGEVLSVSRRNKPDDLGLPGGKIEPEESPEQAIIREVKEEVGINIIKFESVFDRPDFPGWEAVCRCFKVTEYAGKPKATEVDIKVMWVRPERLLEPSCTFANYNSALFSHLGMIRPRSIKVTSPKAKSVDTKKIAEALGAELLPDDHPLAVKMRRLLARTPFQTKK